MEIQYEVVRSRRRRTASIKVEPGQVRVMVPSWVDDAWIANWVQEKRHWISQKQQQLGAQTSAHEIIIEQGAQVPFMGQGLNLTYGLAGQAGVTLQGDQLQISLSRRGSRAPEIRAEEALRGWYQREAENYLAQRLQYWQALMGLNPTGLRVKGFRRRWGSCDNRGGIALNWRLIMTPPELIDYVLVHELAHLKHFNHSARFWALVARFVPEYREYREALQSRHALLRF